MARHLSGRRRKNHRDLLATRGPEEWRGCRRGGQGRAPRLAPPSRRRLRGTDGGGRPPPRGISAGRAPEAASRARAPLSAAEPSTAASSAGLHVLPGGVERSGAERHETLTRKYPPLAPARVPRGRRPGTGAGGRGGATAAPAPAPGERQGSARGAPRERRERTGSASEPSIGDPRRPHHLSGPARGEGGPLPLSPLRFPQLPPPLSPTPRGVIRRHLRGGERGGAPPPRRPGLLGRRKRAGAGGGGGW